MSDDSELAAREAARRFAQRAAAIGVVSFAGGFVIAWRAELDGNYRDETFILLLWLLSLASLIAWAIAFVLSRRRTSQGFELSPTSAHPAETPERRE